MTFLQQMAFDRIVALNKSIQGFLPARKDFKSSQALSMEAVSRINDDLTEQENWLKALEDEESQYQFTRQFGALEE